MKEFVPFNLKWFFKFCFYFVLFCSLSDKVFPLDSTFLFLKILLDVGIQLLVIIYIVVIYIYVLYLYTYILSFIFNKCFNLSYEVLRVFVELYIFLLDLVV